jgi:hypothetical protein
MVIKVSYPFGSHSVLATGLAHMFARFTKDLEKGLINSEEKRRIVMIFEKAFRAASISDGSKKPDMTDPLEQLVELAEASDIESHFRELFRETGYELEFETTGLRPLSTGECRDIDRLGEWARQ